MLPDGRRFPAEHVHEGVFAATLPGHRGARLPARGQLPGGDGGGPLPETITDDPYRYLPTLGEVDLHLIGEGRHEKLWQVLGAHVRTYGQVTGTSFAVWAPNARGVRVIGDFNHWDGRGHPMRSLGGSGVWELFVPDVGDGTRYKFDICGPDGQWQRKADPMAAWPSGRRPPRRWSTRRATSGATGVAGRAGQRAAGERADERVRGAPRLVAARAVLPPSSPSS